MPEIVIDRKRAKDMLRTVSNEIDRSVMRLATLSDAFKENGHADYAKQCELMGKSLLMIQDAVNSFNESV